MPEDIITQFVSRNEPENPPGIETYLMTGIDFTAERRNEPENPPGIETHMLRTIRWLDKCVATSQKTRQGLKQSGLHRPEVQHRRRNEPENPPGIETNPRS